MSGRCLGLLIDNCDQADSYNHFSLHSNSHTKLSEKVRIGSDRNYTFPTESKFSTGVGHLPGGHLPPQKFAHLPPPNSDIYHSQKPYMCQEDKCHPHSFSFFWRTFLGFFNLQLKEHIKDGKEEVLDEVVMEHIK